jgi:hypothetical protein
MTAYLRRHIADRIVRSVDATRSLVGLFWRHTISERRRTLMIGCCATTASHRSSSPSGSVHQYGSTELKVTVHTHRTSSMVKYRTCLFLRHSFTVNSFCVASRTTVEDFSEPSITRVFLCIKFTAKLYNAWGGFRFYILILSSRPGWSTYSYYHRDQDGG